MIKSYLTLFFIFIANISFCQIQIEKLNEDIWKLNNWRVDTTSLGPDTTGIPWDQIPMYREEDTVYLSKKIEIIDYTFSGYEDANIPFKYPQIISVNGLKINIDSMFFLKSKYKIEFDFQQAEIFHIKSKSKDILLIQANMRFFLRCIGCTERLLLVINMSNSKNLVNGFLFNCVKAECGLINLETIQDYKQLKILAKDKNGKYKINVIEL